MKNSSLMDPTDLFVDRHIGSPEDQLRAMLATLGFDSLDELSDATVPADIRMQRPLELHHRPLGPGLHVARVCQIQILT